MMKKVTVRPLIKKIRM